ncbi:hypothetical protein [Kitasatospora sp. P5_F3]
MEAGQPPQPVEAGHRPQGPYGARHPQLDPGQRPGGPVRQLQSAGELLGVQEAFREQVQPGVAEGREVRVGGAARAGRPGLHPDRPEAVGGPAELGPGGALADAERVQRTDGGRDRPAFGRTEQAVRHAVPVHQHPAVLALVPPVDLGHQVPARRADGVHLVRLAVRQPVQQHRPAGPQRATMQLGHRRRDFGGGPAQLPGLGARAGGRAGQYRPVGPAVQHRRHLLGRLHHGPRDRGQARFEQRAAHHRRITPGGGQLRCVVRKSEVPGELLGQPSTGAAGRDHRVRTTAGRPDPGGRTAGPPGLAAEHRETVGPLLPEGAGQVGAAEHWIDE